MPRELIRVPDIPKPLANYSPAARIGHLVFAAGQVASDFKTSVPREARVDPAFPFYGSDIKGQTRFILENLSRTFKAAGTSLDHVVKAQVFHTALANFAGFDEVWKEFFRTPPPRTTVGTTGLLIPHCLVEFDLIATLPATPARAARSAGPQPLANYTEAVVAGDLVFAAGQLASDFKSGVAPEARIDPAFPYYGSSIKRQTRYILDNLATTLKTAGTTLDHVIKAQVFHTDLMNFNGFDEVWKEYFPNAAAHDDRDDRAPGQGHAGRDRRDRGAAHCPPPEHRGPRRPETAGPLHACGAGRRSRVRGRAAGQ